MKAAYRLLLAAFLFGAALLTDLFRVAAAFFAALLRFLLAAILAASAAFNAAFLFLVRAAFLAASALLALDVAMLDLVLSCGYMVKVTHCCPAASNI